jgi:hypothetical protein
MMIRWIGIYARATPRGEEMVRMETTMTTNVNDDNGGATRRRRARMAVIDIR